MAMTVAASISDRPMSARGRPAEVAAFPFHDCLWFWERNYSFDAQISVLVNSAACPSFGIGHRSLVRRTDRPMKLLQCTYRPLGHFNRPGQFGHLSLSRR